MIAYRQPNSIYSANLAVIPASARYAEQVEALQHAAYDDDDVINAEMFRSMVAHFPEGQFLAVETDTDTVVGLTSGMIIQFEPTEDLRESWKATTGDG